VVLLRLAYVLYIDFFVRGILYNVRPHHPPRLPRGGDRGLVVYAHSTVAHPHVLSLQEHVYAVRPIAPLPRGARCGACGVRTL
jgi:hypothetical protein